MIQKVKFLILNGRIIIMKYDKTLSAAVAGCLSLDICPGFTCGNISNFADIIKPSEITHIEGNNIFPGGSVANTGIALKKFGIEPVLLSKIGDDRLGQILKEMIDCECGKASVRLIKSVPTASTAYSIILAPPGIDRAILQNPGANDLFLPDDIDFSALRNCAIFHFGHPSSLRRIYENGGKALENIFINATEAGMITSLDLCPVDPLSDAGKQDWKAILSRVLPNVDFFMPSYGELAAALGMKGSSPSALAETSMNLGAKNVLIKLGSRGMYYCCGDYDAISDIRKRLENRLGRVYGNLDTWIGRCGERTAAAAPRIVSGLGAGDVSIAAYIAAMLRGGTLDEALTAAVREGALCVSHASATGALLPLEELDSAF